MASDDANLCSGGVRINSVAEAVLQPVAQDSVDACRDGDRGAQRQLYERHCRQVYRLMFRMVGPQYAEDLTQQVFLRLFQSLDKFAGYSTFSTWLYRLATNEALQFLRRHKHHQVQPLSCDPVDGRRSKCERVDDRELLDRALSKLAPELRSAFLLREVEQLSYEEIALVLDVAEGTVASRLNRARQMLRQFLEEAS